MAAVAKEHDIPEDSSKALNVVEDICTKRMKELFPDGEVHYGDSCPVISFEGVKKVSDFGDTKAFDHNGKEQKEITSQCTLSYENSNEVILSGYEIDDTKLEKKGAIEELADIFELAELTGRPCETGQSRGDDDDLFAIWNADELAVVNSLIKKHKWMAPLIPIFKKFTNF